MWSWWLLLRWTAYGKGEKWVKTCRKGTTMLRAKPSVWNIQTNHWATRRPHVKHFFCLQQLLVPNLPSSGFSVISKFVYTAWEHKITSNRGFRLSYHTGKLLKLEATRTWLRNTVCLLVRSTPVFMNNTKKIDISNEFRKITVFPFNQGKVVR